MRPTPEGHQNVASGEHTPEPKWQVTRRAVLLGIVLVPFSVYWVVYSEYRLYNILTLNPLFVTPVFYLFLLVLVNEVLSKVAPRYRFNPAELVVIYTMLVISCTIATTDYMVNVVTTMTWAHWLARSYPDLGRNVTPLLPGWLTVSDMYALKGFFQGNASMYEHRVLMAWLKPLVFWSGFIVVCGWVMLCLTVIFRKAWMEDVKLSFPIVRLPFSLIDPQENRSTLRNPLLWLGFGIALGIGLWNGLHYRYPNMPVLWVRATPIQFAQAPWSAMGRNYVTFYPFALGLCYLVPLDISFSCWFFHVFIKMQSVIGHQLGFGSVPDFPYAHEQGMGAWFAFGIALIWASRNHLRRVWHAAAGPEAKSDPREPLSYRTAVWGLALGVALLLVFWRAAGMGIVWAAFTLFTYLLVSIGITRVRAESGGQHAVWDLEPMNMARLFGSNTLGPGNLAASALSHWYWRLNRGHMMPGMLESIKLADDCRVKMRSLVSPIVLAVGLSVVFGFWSCMHIGYTDGVLAKCKGEGTWTAWEAFGFLNTSQQFGFKPEPARWGAAGGAAGLVVMLTWLRAKYAWFPFHPLGYCMGNELRWHWMPFMIAWAAKLIILRYGGLSLYRRSIPFALGLVLGDYTIGAFWSLIGMIYGIQTYQIFH